MSANSIATAPPGRKKLARGKERSDAAPGHAPPTTSTPEGAKENGKLPTGWEWKTIRDLVTDEGVFIDGDWVESKDQDPNGDVRLIQLADVGDGLYRDRSDRYMTKAKAEELRCTFLEKGDVLIARMPDPLGRACIFPGDAKPSVTVVDVAIVRSGNGEFDHRWLVFFVNAHPTRAAISALQAGSTRKRISRGNLATIPLPIPPLPEQRRIVAEIEKQFTRLEAGVAALRRVQANLKRYRAAVLKAACEGRLVPTEAELAKAEDRKFKTGEELLARILTERRQWFDRQQANAKTKKKYVEPAKPVTSSLPSLPNGWTWGTWNQLSNWVTYGFTRPMPHFDAGIPIITAKGVNKGRIDFDGAHLTTKDAYVKLSDKDRPRPGDILITKDGTIGRAAVVDTDRDFCINQSVAAIWLRSCPMERKFMLAVIESELTQKPIWAKARGVAIQHLSITDFAKMALPIPPLLEQTRIVAEVDRRLSVAEELEAMVASNLQRATKLRQSILEEGLTGELAPLS